MDPGTEGQDKMQQPTENSSFPDPVSKEEQEEDLRRKRESNLQSVFGSMGPVILAPAQEITQREELQGTLILQRMARQHVQSGRAAMEALLYEKAVSCFSKAITLQPEETEFHVKQAEAYLQLCDFESAAACYRKAWVLEPGACRDRLAFTYYMQGQCLFDRGLILEALQSFSRAAEVKPGCRAYEVKSMVCLTAVGHASSCLKLVSDWMVSDGPSADLYLLRARLHKANNQTSRCHSDVMSALAHNPSSGPAKALLQGLRDRAEQARQLAVSKALIGQLPQALCMINIALENCPQDPRLYLFRGVLYRRMEDYTAAIEDFVQALELSEEEEKKRKKKKKKKILREKEEQCCWEEATCQLVLTYNDFAVQCFSRGLYAEATLLLNKAIDEDKSRPGLYLNRGDCFFKQGEWCFALADYQQAEEMTCTHTHTAGEMTHDPAVRLRLAVLHNTLGTFCFQDGCVQMAAEMFSLALHYNPSESAYYENRSKTLRKLLDLDGARQDFLCLMTLNPDNQELPAMLMNLFPGRSASDVLTSPQAQAVRQSLSEKFQALSLTNGSAASRSHDPARAPVKELKLCVTDDTLKSPILQVKEAA